MTPREENRRITPRQKEIVHFLKELGNCCKRETIEDIWFHTKWGESTCCDNLKFLSEIVSDKRYKIKREKVIEYQEQYIYWGSGPMPKNYEHADLIAKVWVYFKYIIDRKILSWEREPMDFEGIRPDIRITYQNKKNKGSTLVYVEVERSHNEGITQKMKLYQDEFNKLKIANGSSDYEPFKLLYFYKGNYQINDFTSYNGFKVIHVPIEKLEERPPKPNASEQAVGSQKNRKKAKSKKQAPTN